MNYERILLVIDMQLCAFDGKITPPICDGQIVLENTARLISECRSANIPIVYIQTCVVSGQPYARDTHGWEMHPLLTPDETDLIFHKQWSSAFDRTDLAEQLDSLGVKRMIACGIWSEFCLANTALDAAKLGIDVCIAADAHGTVATDDATACDVVKAQNARLAAEGMLVLPVAELPLLN